MESTQREELSGKATQLFLGIQVSVRKLCRLVGINRQWYYQHRHPSAHQQDDERRSPAIGELREALSGCGSRRVAKALVRAGWKVNHKRVRLLMREARLTCRRKRRIDAHLPPPALEMALAKPRYHGL